MELLHHLRQSIKDQLDSPSSYFLDEADLRKLNNMSLKLDKIFLEFCLSGTLSTHEQQSINLINKILKINA